MNFSPGHVQVFPHPHASSRRPVACFVPAAAYLVRHPRLPSRLGGGAGMIV